ncbi:hypothetical protein LLG88_13415 [bacterium]|nr:hypothetical protein [bacterium]
MNIKDLGDNTATGCRDYAVSVSRHDVDLMYGTAREAAERTIAGIVERVVSDHKAEVEAVITPELVERAVVKAIHDVIIEGFAAVGRRV